MFRHITIILAFLFVSVVSTSSWGEDNSPPDDRPKIRPKGGPSLAEESASIIDQNSSGCMKTKLDREMIIGFDLSKDGKPIPNSFTIVSYDKKSGEN